MSTHHIFNYWITWRIHREDETSAVRIPDGHRKMTSISKENMYQAREARFQSSQCLLAVMFSVSNRRISTTSSLNVITLYLPKLLTSALIGRISCFRSVFINFLSANIDLSQMNVRYGNPLVSTDAKMYTKIRYVCWEQLSVYVCLKVKKVLKTSAIISTWIWHFTCLTSAALLLAC